MFTRRQETPPNDPRRVAANITLFVNNLCTSQNLEPVRVIAHTPHSAAPGDLTHAQLYIDLAPTYARWQQLVASESTHGDNVVDYLAGVRTHIRNIGSGYGLDFEQMSIDVTEDPEISPSRLRVPLNAMIEHPETLNKLADMLRRRHFIGRTAIKAGLLAGGSITGHGLWRFCTAPEERGGAAVETEIGLITTLWSSVYLTDPPDATRPIPLVKTHGHVTDKGTVAEEIPWRNIASTLADAIGKQHPPATLTR